MEPFTLTLTREPADGLSVRGILCIHSASDFSHGAPLAHSEADGERVPRSGGLGAFPTLENAAYLIPCGTYPLEVTYSPRFKRMMPLVSAVPGRSGIRFHPGTRPEHSRGCILVSRADEDRLRDLITSHAPVTLKIING